MPARATIELLARDQGFRAAMANVQTTMGRVADRFRGVAVAARYLLAATGGSAALAVRIASDMEESSSAFRVAFGSGADEAEKWVEATARSMNRGRLDLIKYMSTLQNTFVPFGFARDKATELSKSVTTLAVDLGSFRNMADADVLRDLQSALVGNHETMRKYGVVINDTNLKQQMLSMGLIKGKEAATEQDKVMARLAIIYAQTRDAQGDAVRTGGGFANQLKGLGGQVQDLAVAIGTPLMSALNAWISGMRQGLPWLVEWIKQHQLLAGSIAAVSLATLGLAAFLPQLVGGFGMLVAAGGSAAKAIGAVTAALKAFIVLNAAEKVQALYPAFFALQGAAMAAGTALKSAWTSLIGLAANPIALGLAAIAAAGWVAYRSWDQAAESLERTHAATKNLADLQAKLAATRTTQTGGSLQDELTKRSQIANLNRALAQEARAEAERLRNDPARKGFAGQEAVAEATRRQIAEQERFAAVYDERAAAAEREADAVRKRMSDEDEARKAQLEYEQSPEKQRYDKYREEFQRQALLTDQLGKTQREQKLLEYAAAGYTREQLESLDAILREQEATEKLLETQKQQQETIEEANKSAQEKAASIARDILALTGGATEDQLELFDLQNLGVAEETLKRIAELQRERAAARDEKEESEQYQKRVEDARRLARTQEEINAEKKEEYRLMLENRDIEQYEYERLVAMLDKVREASRVGKFEGLTEAYKRIAEAAGKSTPQAAPAEQARRAEERGRDAAEESKRQTRTLVEIRDYLKGAVEGLLVQPGRLG